MAPSVQRTTPKQMATENLTWCSPLSRQETSRSTHPRSVPPLVAAHFPTPPALSPPRCRCRVIPSEESPAIANYSSSCLFYTSINKYGRGGLRDRAMRVCKEKQLGVACDLSISSHCSIEPAATTKGWGGGRTELVRDICSRQTVCACLPAALLCRA